jgi:hypothetical protein
MRNLGQRGLHNKKIRDSYVSSIMRIVKPRCLRRESQIHHLCSLVLLWWGNILKDACWEEQDGQRRNNLCRVDSTFSYRVLQWQEYIQLTQLVFRFGLWQILIFGFATTRNIASLAS